MIKIAKPRVIKNILSQAYAAPVDDEIVDVILKPGLEPGAADVFLDFISYSSGPLPEELLPQCTRPVRILWGENDPWEPIDLGREYGNQSKYPCVDEFVTLKGIIASHYFSILVFTIVHMFTFYLCCK